MIRPDYDGGSIVNLMSSLATGLGSYQSALPATALLPADEVRAAACVVLFIIDGLGDDYLAGQDCAPHLRAARRGRLTSVFPSTTASAITTFLTGDAPAQHGVTGWHMYLRELGTVTTILPGRARFGGASLGEAGIDLPALLGNRPFAERLDADVAFVMPRDIADSTYTLAHCAGAPVSAYGELPELFGAVEAAVASGAGYVHAYFPDLDAIGHRFGMGSDTAAELLARVDAEFGACCARLSGSNTLLVVTADHGQVDTTTGDWVIVDPGDEVADCLRIPLCGEPRAAYAYPVPGRGDELVAKLTARFGSADCVVDARGWRDAGWFGPGVPHPELASRTGDLLVLPSAHRAVKDWLPGERRFGVTGTHGGVTAAEMGVPLLITRT